MFWKFVQAVFRKWVYVLTSSILALILAFLPGVGYLLPHWVYWVVASIGWVIAAFLAWRDEYQRAESLQQHLDSEEVKLRKEAEKRELIGVIAALRRQKEKLLYWREFTKSKCGREVDTERISLEDSITLIIWVEKTNPGLLEAIKEAEHKIETGERLLNELLSQPMNYRSQQDALKISTLLDEALPHLDAALGGFERYKS